MAYTIRIIFFSQAPLNVIEELASKKKLWEGDDFWKRFIIAGPTTTQSATEQPASAIGFDSEREKLCERNSFAFFFGFFFVSLLLLF
jgi:hypothetical protein